MSKTEAILFSWKGKHRQARAEKPIRVGDQTVHFARDATRRFGVRPDSALTLRDNRRQCIGRARQAEARARRLMTRYGVPRASTRNLQLVIIQGTMLYATELTWKG